MPSIASRAPTRRVVGASNAVTVTAVDPIGFGRSGRACLEDAGQRDCRVPRGVGLEDFAVGEMEPGQHDQFVTGLDAVQRVEEGGLDLEQRLGCALERLVGGVGGRVQTGADDADRMHDVGIAFGHFVCESRTRRDRPARLS